MKLLHLLLLPWMTWSTLTRRIFALGLLVVAVIVTVGYALRSSPDAGHLHLMHGLATFSALLWSVTLSRNLLLANDAHRLRLPALAREVVLSSALYVVLTIVAPALLLALMGASAPVALTELALGAGIGMGYAALPLWLGFWACLTPSLSSAIGNWLPVPSSHPAGFVHWAAPLAAGLWVLIALNWRQVARCGDDASRWLMPMVLRWRRLSAIGRNGAQLEAEMLRRRSARNQPRVDLRRVGPGHAATSLRVALGGWSMPQTALGRLRQTGLAAFHLSWMAAIVMIARRVSSDAGLRPVLDMLFSPVMLAWGASLFGSVLGWTRADALRARWSRDNAELAVLALLPGLGNAAQARRALLHAGLLPGLGAQATLLAIALATAAWLGLPARSFALLLLAYGSSMLANVSLGVAALGGTMLHRAWQSVLAISAMVLMLTTIGLALPPLDHVALAPHRDALCVFALLWASLLVILLAIGRRGWRVFQRHPHPFLPATV